MQLAVLHVEYQPGHKSWSLTHGGVLGGGWSSTEGGTGEGANFNAIRKVIFCKMACFRVFLF